MNGTYRHYVSVIKIVSYVLFHYNRPYFLQFLSDNAFFSKTCQNCLKIVKTMHLQLIDPLNARFRCLHPSPTNFWKSPCTPSPPKLKSNPPWFFLHPLFGKPTVKKESKNETVRKKDKWTAPPTFSFWDSDKKSSNRRGKGLKNIAPWTKYISILI